MAAVLERAPAQYTSCSAPLACVKEHTGVLVTAPSFTESSAGDGGRFQWHLHWNPL